MTGGELVARTLKGAGVGHVFTLCGGHILPIYDGCLGEAITLVDVRHEQAAAHCADAYARLTRRVGVAVVAPGPGVTDAVTRSKEHTSELQSRLHLVCRLLLEKKKKKQHSQHD